MNRRRLVNREVDGGPGMLRCILRPWRTGPPRLNLEPLGALTSRLFPPFR